MREHIQGIDHVVILVRDLDRAEDTYSRLGFTLTPRGYHTLGSQNHCLMFGTNYVELLAVPKPHPAMLLELMAELALGKRELLMIGDTSHDLGMAQNAGVDAVAVSYGAHPEESLQPLAPRACVSSVVELRQWLMTNA